MRPLRRVRTATEALTQRRGRETDPLRRFREKRRWMHSLALLLEIIGDNSAILKTDREREEYNSVCVCALSRSSSPRA